MSDASSSHETTDRPRTSDGSSSELPVEFRRFVWWAAFVGLLLVVLVAGVNFYGAASHAIGLWVSARYEPLFRAAFNLIVLLGAGAAMAVLTRHFDRWNNTG